MRPKEELQKHPASQTRIHKTLDENEFSILLGRYQHIHPSKR